MSTSLDYHNILLSIQRNELAIQKNEIAITNLLEKVLKIDLNTTDITDIEKKLIILTHDLSDIRRDVKDIDETIVKLQNSINNMITTQNDSISFIPKITNKNFITVLIVSVILLTVISNKDTRDVMLKILAILMGS